MQISDEDRKKASELATRIRLECCGANGEIARNCQANEVEGWIVDIVAQALSAARAEQREADAKISQKFGCDCLKTDKETIHQIGCDEGTKGFRIAAAIRGDGQ